MIRSPISADASACVARALDAIPEYDQALQLAEQAQRALDGLKPVPEPTEPDPLKTGNVTAKWVDAQLKHTAAVAELDARRRVLVELRQRAEAHAAGIIGERLDDILARLHGELTKLLAEARDVADQLGGVTSALEAVDRDVAPQWKRLSELAGDYAELRAGQQLLMVRFDSTRLQSAKRSDGSGDEHASDLYLGNLDSLWPDWRAPHRTMFRIDGGQDRLEPWPADDTERLLWLVTSKARPWVPTRSQCDQLWHERQRRANPHPKRIAGSASVLNRPIFDRIATPIQNVC